VRKPSRVGGARARAAVAVPCLGSFCSVRTDSWDTMPTARASLPTVAAASAAAAAAAADAEAAAAAAEAVSAHPG